MLEKYSADVLRYYLMREVPFNGDGDFSWTRLEQRYNADLANDLGNLINRTLSMIQRYRNGIIPAVRSQDLLPDAEAMRAKYSERMAELDYSAALESLWGFISRANRYVEESKPWALAKDTAGASRLDAVLGELAESVRLIPELVAPFMPTAAEQIRVQLGEHGKIGVITPLFPKKA